MAKRNALGKGLGALIPGANDETNDEINLQETPSGQMVIEISLGDIEPNPHQPRTEFDPKAVSELAQSIREKGILQPISVCGVLGRVINSLQVNAAFGPPNKPSYRLCLHW
jgi:ParB family chromosome partitioning protein